MTDALTNAQIQISGELLSDAQVRTVLMGDNSTPMPVICLLIKADNSCHGPMRAEQVYPPAMRDAAEAAAKAMKKGLRVTVIAPLAHLRVTLAMAASIQTHGRARPTHSHQHKEAAHANA